MSSETWVLIFAGISVIDFICLVLFSFYYHKTRFTQWIGDNDLRRVSFGFMFVVIFVFSSMSIIPYSVDLRVWHWALGIEEAPFVIAERETDPKVWKAYKDVGKEVTNLDKARGKMLNALEMRRGEEAVKQATKEYLEQLRKVDKISESLQGN